TFALEPCLHSASDQLDRHWPFLAVSYRQAGPRLAGECLAPLGHRLPWGFGPPSTPCVRGQRDLQIAHRRVTRYAQHVALASLPHLPANPRLAAQLIVTRHPTVRDVRTPLVKHLQALLVPRLILHLQRDMTCLTPELVPCPVLGQGQAKVE